MSMHPGSMLYPSRGGSVLFSEGGSMVFSSEAPRNDGRAMPGDGSQPSTPMRSAAVSMVGDDDSDEEQEDEEGGPDMS